MRRLVFVFASLLLAFAPLRASAQQAPPPGIVTQGLDLLTTAGPDAALDAWLKWWPADTRAGAKAQLLGGLTQIQTVTGQARGYDFLGSADWGPHVRRLYFTVLAKDRPFYARFDVYQTSGEWRVLNVTLNTDPAEVFPPGWLMPGHS